MLSVENQLSWMPSTLGGSASQNLGGSASNIPAQELALNAPEADADAKDGDFAFFGDDGFSFADLIDVVNPLQHIPFVSTIYRETTGDEIAAAPRAMGSTLFFGPIGLVGAIANVFVEENTGKDIGGHMASWFAPDDPEAATTELAQAQSPGAALNPEDPVLAWARGEADWAKQNARGNKAKPNPDTTGDNTSVPDAAPLLRETAPTPAPQTTPTIDLAEMAVLSHDMRSAAWAYEIAANLRPTN